jgi:hypothetical protein
MRRTLQVRRIWAVPKVVGYRNTEFLGGRHRLAAVDQKLGVSK